MRGALGHCNCNSLRGLGDVSETITTTAQAIPCTELFRQYYTTGSTWARIEYNLCLAWHHMEQYAIGAGSWFRARWNSLLEWFSSLWNSAQGGGTWVGTQLQRLKQATENFLGTLRQQLGIVADRMYSEFGSIGQWILIAGGVFLAIELAPAVDDLVHAATKGKRNG